MSQHIVKVDDRIEALVGWDPPMETYFCQVYRLDEEGERVTAEDGGTIAWVGRQPREIYDLEEFIRQLGPHKVRLDRKLLADLYGDRDEGR